jgi:CheY-like chemotaxis protein
VAILDMQMPGMDGMMLARAIRADPALDTTVLVMMTSIGRRSEAEERAAGLAASLTKPVKQSQLLDCLLTVAAADGMTETRPALRPADTDARAGRRGRVLVAEDNPINQKVARLQLEKLGCRVDVVANGREALDAVAQIPYDLVFMDCQMPVMDGFQSVGEIRRREGADRHLRVIAMTASALEGDRDRCLAAGMDDYVSKPVNGEILRKLVHRWLAPG